MHQPGPFPKALTVHRESLIGLHDKFEPVFDFGRLSRIFEPDPFDTPLDFGRGEGRDEHLTGPK